VAICTSFLNESDPFWRSGRQSLPYFLNRDDLSTRWYDCDSAQVWPKGGEDSFYFFLENISFSDLMPKSALDNVEKLELGGETAWGVELDTSADLNHQLANLSQPQDDGEPVLFGDMVKFLGFILENEKPRTGGQVQLKSYWQILKPLPEDMAIFVHMVNEADEIVAQGDALALLSDSLKGGDIFAQRHSILMPPGSGTGNFPLYIGLYSRPGEFPPLPITNTGTGMETRLQIATIRPQP
jgi:hypothetical protein